MVVPSKRGGLVARSASTLSLLLAGCSDAPPAASPEAGCTNPAPVARFTLPRDGSAPAPFEIPFPSDIYRSADGTLRVLDDFAALGVQRNGDLIADSLRGLDGFGRNSGAVFVVDDPPAGCAGGPVEVAPASLAAELSAVIVDLDPTTPSARARVPSVAGWHPRFRTVTVQPDGVVLAPGRRYAALLTSGVRSTAGAALAPSPAFAALRDSAPGARASGVGALYGPAIERALTVLGSGFDRARIVAVSVFTTQSRHRQLHASAEALRAGRYGAAPTLGTDAAAAAPYTVARFGQSPHDGWTATLGAWLGTPRRVDGQDLPGAPDPTAEGANVGMAHDALGAVFTGTFVTNDFRGPDGTITIGPDGAPSGTPRATRIPVTFALPRGPVPPAGFPAVNWGHGLSSQRRSMLVIVNELARRGVATVAIDAVTFGQRQFPVDTMSLQSGTYRGPDGFGDQAEYSPVTFLGALRSMVALRDNLRQAVLDFVQLRRLVTNPALDLSFVSAEYGGTAPTLDRAHVGYVADSLGGVLGTMFGAVEPGVNPLVLNVPGGALFTAVTTDAPVLGALVSTLPVGLFGVPADAPADRFHPLLNVLQMGLDPADPASFAAELTHPATGRSHDVWVVESLWDEIISNRSTDLLAREMGLPHILPARPVAGLTAVTTPTVSANLAGGATAAFFQCVPCTHGGNIATRYSTRTYATPFPREGASRFPRAPETWRIREPVVIYQRAIARFFSTAFTGAASISVAGMEPLVDLDDDGWTDDEEAAARTSPNDPRSHPPGAAPHTRNVGF